MRLLSLKTVSLLMLLSTVAFNFAIFEVTREDTGSEDVGALETAAEANPTIQRAQQFAKKFEELYSPSKPEKGGVVASAAWRSSAALKATEAAEKESTDVDDDEELWQQTVTERRAEYKSGMWGGAPTRERKYYPESMSTEKLETTVAEHMASIKRLRMISAKSVGLSDNSALVEFQQVSLRVNEFLDIYGDSEVVLDHPKFRELYFCVQGHFLQLETPAILAPNTALTGQHTEEGEGSDKPAMLVYDSLASSLPSGGRIMPYLHPLSVPGLQGDENAVKKGFAAYTSVSQHSCTDRHMDEIMAAKKGASLWRRSRPVRSHTHSGAAGTDSGDGESGDGDELKERLKEDSAELEQLQAALAHRKATLTENLQQYLDEEKEQDTRVAKVKAKHFVRGARRLLGTAEGEEEGGEEEGGERQGQRREQGRTLLSGEWDAPEWDPASLEAELQQTIASWSSCLPLQCSRDVQKCSKHESSMGNVIADGILKGASLVSESTGGVAGELVPVPLLQSWFNGINSFMHGFYIDVLYPIYHSMTNFQSLSKKERMRLRNEKHMREKAGVDASSDGDDGVKKIDEICCSEVLLQLLVDVTSFLSEAEAGDGSTEGESIGGIPYSIFYGTLLGSVRNEQLIPWTSDIDLLVPRWVFILAPTPIIDISTLNNS
jgi:hypothetical protein